MLTPSQFDAYPARIVALYQELEDSVIADIARRIANTDFASAAWQVQRLSESGQVYESILKKVSAITGQSEAELANIMQKAGVQAVRFDDKIYKAAGLEPLPLNLSPQMAQVLQIAILRTAGEMRNLTQSLAATGSQAFTQAADLAYLQVSTGTMGYDQAIRAAVNSIGESGLQVVYPSGHVNKLDVAIRRAVLSGVGKSSGDLQLARAQDMGQDLVEVSAHIGARPTHQIWQGKVYSVSGTDPKYPPFEQETGYGSVTGLGGVNCRHSFYPFFKGISKEIYNDAMRNELTEKTVTYQGKEISTYEATQVQRGIERNIRSWKRRANALDAAGLDNSFEKSKVSEWQAKMRGFTKETGLQRQYVRESVGSSGKTQVANVAPAVESVVPAKEFVPAKTIDEANSYAKNQLGLDYAEYKGLDLKIANEWNKGLSESFDDFPELKNTIKATGTTQARYRTEFDYYRNIAEEKYIDVYRKFGDSESRVQKRLDSFARKFATRTPANTYAYSISGTKLGLDGIFVNGKYKYEKAVELLKKDVVEGFHPLGTGSIKSNLDHEIAHQLDGLFGLRKNEKITDLYIEYSRSGKIESGLSKYATTNKAEFIAEAWSEYRNSPTPRKIAQEIGDIIMSLSKR